MSPQIRTLVLSFFFAPTGAWTHWDFSVWGMLHSFSNFFNWSDTCGWTAMGNVLSFFWDGWAFSDRKIRSLYPGTLPISSKNSFGNFSRIPSGDDIFWLTVFTVNESQSTGLSVLSFDVSVIDCSFIYDDVICGQAWIPACVGWVSVGFEPVCSGCVFGVVPRVVSDLI